jgi:RNA polymerase sigma-70 factor (ECF subfamily)
MRFNGHILEQHPAVLALARRMAGRLAGQVGFHVQDQPDLMQELALRVLRRLPAYDARRGRLPDFCSLVLHNGAANLRRDQRARSRRTLRTRSLHDPIGSPEGRPLELGSVLTQKANDARRGRSTRSDHEHRELVLDVQTILVRLPARLREFAERRMAGQSMAAIARAMGMPRTTLYGWQQRLRRRFQQAGLGG